MMYPFMTLNDDTETSTGRAILSNNNSKLPEKVLSRLIRLIAANSAEIIEEWLNRFGEIKYFC